MVGRISAKGIKNLRSKVFLIPFSNCSQYPVVSRNSANGIKKLKSKV